jgi:hypothetical protein
MLVSTADSETLRMSLEAKNCVDNIKNVKGESKLWPVK